MQLRRDDRGVTLIEVIVSIAVLTIIIGPLSAALIGFLRNTDDTTRRLNESHDMQLSAAYFAQDVQAIGVRDWNATPYSLQQSIEVGVAPDGGVYHCGTTATTATAIVRLAWDDPTTAVSRPTVMRASYVIKTVGTERQLRRITCAGSDVITSEVVLAHNVDVTAPVVSCSSTCTDAPAVPQTVTLVLMIKDPGSSGPAVSVTLTGQRRQT
jgi:prepilin-type N-terminal cleavage/methylation domain-containing protein